MHLVDKAGSQFDLFAAIKTANGSFTNRDLRLSLGENDHINVYVSSSPVRATFGDTTKTGYVLIIRDITREKNLEDERDEFISVVSHELRNPVAIAEGSLSNAVLLAERSHLPDTIVHTLHSSHEQIVFLASLINDLAMLSRADRGRLALSIDQVDIVELVNSLVHDYQPQAAKKGLELKAEAAKSLPKIFSSQLYIREILQNFVTNALRYTAKGGITIKVSASDAGVSLSVADTGYGIDNNEQAKLFTKFFRSEDFRVRQINGTGLGLYVSAKLARLLGGSITLASELNKGSTFTLNLASSAYRATPQAAAKTVA